MHFTVATAQLILRYYSESQNKFDFHYNILLILPCTSVPCGHSVHIGTSERKKIFFVHYISGIIIFINFFHKTLDISIIIVYNLIVACEKCNTTVQKNGGIAQLARVLGSYPIGRRFESHCRYYNGPLVKRLRRCPFTAES